MAGVFIVAILGVGIVVAAKGKRLSLHEAAFYGNVEALELALARGADIEGHVEGATPLILAARQGHVEIVRRLTLAGADVKATALWGHSALLEAAWRGHVPVVRHLLEDARFVASDLLEAARVAGQQGNLDCLDAIVEHASRQPDAPQILEAGAFGAARGGRATLLHDLLRRGVDPDFRFPSGAPLLMYATLSSDPDTVRVLLHAGANAHATDQSGQSALFYMYASRTRQTREVFELLVHARVDPDTTDMWGRTALMQKAEDDDVELVELLLEAGADPLKLDGSSKTALAYAWGEAEPLIKVAVDESRRNLKR